MWPAADHNSTVYTWEVADSHRTVLVICRAVRKSRIHDRRDYRHFRHVPRFFGHCHDFDSRLWILTYYMHANFSLRGHYYLSFAVLFHFGRAPVNGYATNGHLFNFAYLLAAGKRAQCKPIHDSQRWRSAAAELQWHELGCTINGSIQC